MSGFRSSGSLGIPGEFCFLSPKVGLRGPVMRSFIDGVLSFGQCFHGIQGLRVRGQGLGLQVT